MVTCSACGAEHWDNDPWIEHTKPSWHMGPEYEPRTTTTCNAEQSPTDEGLATDIPCPECGELNVFEHVDLYWLYRCLCGYYWWVEPAE